MSMLLWRSLAATLSFLVLRFAVALSYAAGFNAMLFLPLYQARAQSPAPISIDARKDGPALTVESVTSPARQAGSPALEKVLRSSAKVAAASSNPQPVQQNAGSSAPQDSSTDYAPAGAVDIGQVDPGTGKLSFSGPIASIGGATTPAFSLSASYSSTQVYETAINWNYEQVPSEVGLGFSLPSAHLRIARLASSTGVAWNDSFMLMTGGSDYRLELIGEDSTNKIKYYSTNDANHLRVEYRSTFLPVFDWVNGKIDDDVASDLYAFYATGAGADRVQFAQDPYYALAFGSRYQEPAGRDNQGTGVG